jgi:hypothetical protein
MPTFSAYYSEDAEYTFTAPDWQGALLMALARTGDVRGRLEALELTSSPDLMASVDRHPR